MTDISGLYDTTPLDITAIKEWKDWRWQQKNAYRDEAILKKLCGGWSEKISENINKNLIGRKIQITPYYLHQILKANLDKDITKNPLWRQVIPFWDEESGSGYDGNSENWELDHEMKTPICQHKYDNRVILRMVNACNSYCQFCFEALRTLEKDSSKSNAGSSSFTQSIAYIRNTPSVEEVILSGGDPLMLTDGKLDECLSEIRSIRDNLLIRIHSRALTFNPFRITPELIGILDEHKINAFGVHVCHPAELSNDFKDAITKIQKVVPIVFSNMPLLRGINDNEKVLHDLFMTLYKMGIKPYYLYHFMPFSPGSAMYKASVNEGITLMNKLKRRISNIAMPEYVLPHAKGKFTVPLIKDIKQFPQHIYKEGKRVYQFINWQGDECEWSDD